MWLSIHSFHKHLLCYSEILIIALSDKQKPSAMLETVAFPLYLWRHTEKKINTGDIQVLRVMTKKGKYSVKEIQTCKIIYVISNVYLKFTFGWTCKGKFFFYYLLRVDLGVYR